MDSDAVALKKTVQNLLIETFSLYLQPLKHFPESIYYRSLKENS